MDRSLHIGWRRREFESSLSLDRPPLRSGHPRRTGACSVFHQFHKTQKGQSFQTTLSAFGGGGGS